MQSLDIISVNIWHILISLINLVLLFLIIKKFLYKPVKNVMAKRQAEIENNYLNAENAENAALNSKAEWEKKLGEAEKTADNIISDAAKTAETRGNTIVAEAKEKAENIIKQAEEQATLEHKKAEAQMKKEIADISTELAQKVLEREIDEKDHRKLIDSFIEDLGEAND